VLNGPTGLSVRHFPSTTAERAFKSGTDGSNPVPSSSESDELVIIEKIGLVEEQLSPPMWACRIVTNNRDALRRSDHDKRQY